MRSRPMIITEVTSWNSAQVPLIDHDDMVQAFSANASDHPFRIAVLPRTPSRCRNLPDTHSINSRGEVVSVDPITIPYEVARHSVVGKCLHELLCCPRGSRVFRDIEMQNTSTVRGRRKRTTP